MKENDFWADAEVVSTYTRAEALADGSLIDQSEVAKEAGFKYPLAITSGLHGVIQKAIKDGADTIDWIMWDILTMFKIAIKKDGGSDKVWFQFSLQGKIIDLWSVINGGDDGKPVITIMLTTED